MNIDFHSLDSRVARRIVLTFLLATLLPLLLMASLAYTQVSNELRDASSISVKRLAKQGAMDVFDRLSVIKDQLNFIAKNAPVKSVLQSSGLQLGLKDRVHKLFWLKRQEATQSYVNGEGLPIDVLARLNAKDEINHPMLITLKEGDEVRLFLIVPAKNRPTWRLGAEINRDFLWESSGIVERDESICVLDSQGQVIFCNQIIEEAWLNLVRPSLGTHSAPRFLEKGKNESYLTVSWSLFLEPHYKVDYWHFVVGSPESIVMKPLNFFQVIFPLLTLLALLISAWLSLYLVRNNLRPLDMVLSAAKRLSAGDFEARSNVESGDEFELVGKVFDEAAEKLGKNFKDMQIISKLDRKIRVIRSYGALLDVVRNSMVEITGAPCAVVLNEELSGETSLLGISLKQDERVAYLINAPALLPKETCYGIASALEGKFPFVKFIKATPNAHLNLITVQLDKKVIACLIIEDNYFPKDSLVILKKVADIMSMTVQNLLLTNQLSFQAHHDPLTGLPNRLGITKDFVGLRNAMQREGGVLAVMVLDLNRFKQINDSLGHAAGDDLLVSVARRLSNSFRNRGLVSRYSGDEFVVLVKCPVVIKALEFISTVGCVVNQAFDLPFEISGRTLDISVSIGVTIPEGNDHFDKLLQQADMAMYRAKEKSGTSLSFYDNQLEKNLTQRIELEHALKKALPKGELEVYYQPIFKAGKIDSAEALLRWNSQEIGAVSPAKFITIAEEIGIIEEIGIWVFKKVCQSICEWSTQGKPFNVSVNLSARQLLDESLVEKMASVIALTGVDTRQLTLEITETALISGMSACITVLEQLRGLGMHLTIDDFGTGYASLKYLRNLPVDGVKIDMMFVSELPESKKDAAIVSAVVMLANEMNLKVVAEGVETQAQADFLKAKGLEYFQGFLFSKPILKSKLEQLF